MRVMQCPGKTASVLRRASSKREYYKIIFMARSFRQWVWIKIILRGRVGSEMCNGRFD